MYICNFGVILVFVLFLSPNWLQKCTCLSTVCRGWSFSPGRSAHFGRQAVLSKMWFISSLLWWEVGRACINICLCMHLMEDMCKCASLSPALQSLNVNIIFHLLRALSWNILIFSLAVVKSVNLVWFGWKHWGLVLVQSEQWFKKHCAPHIVLPLAGGEQHSRQPTKIH